MLRRLPTLLATAALVGGCDLETRHEAESFLSAYDDAYLQLYEGAERAAWDAESRIVDGDSADLLRTRRAREMLAAFVGSTDNVRRIRALLAERPLLTDMQVVRLERLLYHAAEYSQAEAERVRERIVIETTLGEEVRGVRFSLDGGAVTPGRLERILAASTDPVERRAAWEAAMVVGPRVGPGLERLRAARNGPVRTVGFSDYFAFRAAGLALTSNDVLELMDSLVARIWPLYRELHTWTRYELAHRYGEPVPDRIPAHWLGDRLGRDWSGMVRLEPIDPAPALARESAEYVVRRADAFYASFGLDPLPDSFWERSSLLALPPDSPHRKRPGAVVRHVDLAGDVRALMSVQPDPAGYATALRELGRAHVLRAHALADVPPTLRHPQNRVYPEAIGALIERAAFQPRALARRGLVPRGARLDLETRLLEEALRYVAAIPWAAGVMTRFEHALYAGDLPADQWNALWWDLVRRYQGIEPPEPRGSDWADGLADVEAHLAGARAYDRALATALLYHLHMHIARRVLRRDPYDVDYHGSRAVGRFLRPFMRPGAGRLWQEVPAPDAGRPPDGRAIVEYFAPLHAWLVDQNRGRAHTLPAIMPSAASGRAP